MKRDLVRAPLWPLCPPRLQTRQALLRKSLSLLIWGPAFPLHHPSQHPAHSVSSLPGYPLSSPLAPEPVLAPQMKAARTQNAENHSKQGLAAQIPLKLQPLLPCPGMQKYNPAGRTSSGKRGRGQGRFCVCLSVLQTFPPQSVFLLVPGCVRSS